DGPPNPSVRTITTSRAAASSCDLASRGTHQDLFVRWVRRCNLRSCIRCLLSTDAGFSQIGNRQMATPNARRSISARSEHYPKVVAQLSDPGRGPDCPLGLIASRARVDSAF